MDVLSTSNGTINGALTKVWKVVLTSTNGALKFVNFDPGETLTLVVQEDASGSNYTLTFPSTVLWQAGQAPNRDTTANAVSVFRFTFDGTNFRDTDGAPAKLPSRIASNALATIALVGAGAGIVLSLSSGGGQGTGSLPSALKIKSASGAQTLAVIDGSGGYVTGGSGGLATGVATPGTSGYKTGKFYVDPSGNGVFRGTMSGTSTLTLSPMAARTNQMACYKANGTLGYCTGSGHLNGTCGTGCN